MSKIILDSIDTSPSRENPSLENFYLEREKHFYNLPTQRNFVWDIEKQSKLIMSLMAKYPIGQLVVHERDGVEEFLDGQQRAKTIEVFFDNKLRLTDNIPDISLIINPRTLEKKTFEIAGKTFDELDYDVKNALKTRIITIEKYRNLNDVQIDKIIELLNNGLSLTNIERIRMSAERNVQQFVTKIKNMDFFQRKVNIRPSSKAGFMDDKIIYKIIMYEMGEYDSLSDFTMKQFAEDTNRDSSLVTNEVRNTLVNVFDYLGGQKEPVFPVKDSFLKVPNIIPIYALGKRALEDDINPRDLLNIVQKFKENTPEEYERIANKRYTFILDDINTQVDIIIDFYKKELVAK